MAIFIIIAPALVLVLGVVEAFTILSSGTRSRRAVAAISILGLVMYVGGYATGLIGERLQPGVDSWCWGAISSVGIIMMVIGFVGAVIVIPVGILTVIFCRGNKAGANQQMQPIAAKRGSV